MIAMLLIVFASLAFSGINSLPVVSPIAPDEIIVEGYKPYEFGYQFGDGLGLSQYRREIADENGLVQGSYGYVDPDGLYRNVEYKADSNGYRAVVKSNEPGLANQNSADVNFIVEPPPPEVLLKSTVPQNAVAVVESA